MQGREKNVSVIYMRDGIRIRRVDHDIMVKLFICFFSCFEDKDEGNANSRGKAEADRSHIQEGEKSKRLIADLLHRMFWPGPTSRILLHPFGKTLTRPIPYNKDRLAIMLGIIYCSLYN